MKKIILIIIIIFNILCLNGCIDNKEIHEVSFASSLGLDYNIDTEEYIVILYFINTINNVSVDYGLSEPEMLGFTAQGTGKTITEALMKIQTFSETNLNLKHLESVVLTETFFNEKNIFDFYYFCRNSHLFFYTFEILITDSKLQDLFLVDNMTDSPSYYTILTGKKAGFDYHPKTFLDFSSDILTPNFYVIYPKITVKENVFNKDDKPYKTIGITGYSIIKEDYSISTYDSSAISGIKFFDNFSVYTNYTDGLSYTIKNYKLDKHLKEGILNIDISYEILIINNLYNLNDEEIIKKIKLFVISEINSVLDIMKEDKIDIFNVSFLNNARGKLSFDISWESIEIDYHLKSHLRK